MLWAALKNAYCSDINRLLHLSMENRSLATETLKPLQTEIFPLELLFFHFLQEIQTSILLAYVHKDILSIVA